MNNEDVVINLAMVKIGDKVLELEEHLAYQRTLIAELKQLMKDWERVLVINDATLDTEVN
jgi:uncharacterized coiled-coil protein SlyX